MSLALGRTVNVLCGKEDCRTEQYSPTRLLNCRDSPKDDNLYLWVELLCDKIMDSYPLRGVVIESNVLIRRGDDSIIGDCQNQMWNVLVNTWKLVNSLITSVHKKSCSKDLKINTLHGLHWYSSLSIEMVYYLLKWLWYHSASFGDTSLIVANFRAISLFTIWKQYWEKGIFAILRIATCTSWFYCHWNRIQILLQIQLNWIQFYELDITELKVILSNKYTATFSEL